VKTGWGLVVEALFAERINTDLFYPSDTASCR
jgi:hypothetical protein